MTTTTINWPVRVKPPEVEDVKQFVEELRDFLRRHNIRIVKGDWDAGELAFAFVWGDYETDVTISDNFTEAPGYHFVLVDFVPNRGLHPARCISGEVKFNDSTE